MVDRKGGVVQAYGQMLEEMLQRTKNKANLQRYFRGYKDGVKVFLEEFWDRIQSEDGWRAPSSRSVLRDRNAYLSRSRIVG